jgi:hypothetical protein
MGLPGVFADVEGVFFLVEMVQFFRKQVCEAVDGAGFHFCQSFYGGLDDGFVGCCFPVEELNDCPKVCFAEVVVGLCREGEVD